jgi:uncharacterized membrane protein
MQSAKSFIKTTLLGGIVVILPITIIVAVFNWLYGKITTLIQPLTDMLVARVSLRETIADLLVIATILLVCFVVGLIVKTQVGRYIHEKLETRVLTVAPGYNLVRETVAQFLGRRKSPFSSVAVVNLFGSKTMATAFVTDEHSDGSFTVFVPTGPNPTSGQIYHLQAEHVHQLDLPVDDTMRSIISCGAGSGNLISALRKEA